MQGYRQGRVKLPNILSSCYYVYKQLPQKDVLNFEQERKKTAFRLQCYTYKDQSLEVTKYRAYLISGMGQFRKMCVPNFWDGHRNSNYRMLGIKHSAIYTIPGFSQARISVTVPLSWKLGTCTFRNQEASCPVTSWKLGMPQIHVFGSCYVQQTRS